MLAGFAAEGGLAWFFKMVGPKEVVAAQEPAFRKLLESVRFPEAGQTPKWELPAGWREESRDPDGGLRVATLMSSGETPLELAVTKLPAPSGLDNAYVVVNVNRWRRQMKLAAIEAFELETHIQRLEVDGKELVLADMLGEFSSGGPMAPPFASPPRRPAGPPPSSEIGYDTPDGWQQVANDSISQLAFEVVDGDDQIKITVSAAGGDLLANINRWCGQVGSPKMTIEELPEKVEPIKIGAVDALYVSLVGPAEASPRETILGVIARTPTDTWFIKLRGDWQLAERERERFESFVQSLRF